MKATATAALTLTGDGFSFTDKGIIVDATPTEGAIRTQSIGTGWTEIQFPVTGAAERLLGTVFIKNNSETASLEIAPAGDGTNTFGLLLPGAFMLLPVGLNDESDQLLWARASAGTVQVTVACSDRPASPFA